MERNSRVTCEALVRRRLTHQNIANFFRCLHAQPQCPPVTVAGGLFADDVRGRGRDVLARQAVVTRFGSPEALAEWRQWKAETERMRQEGGPVQRCAVTSDEPPALVLMRGSFGPILAGSVAIGSFLFAFLAFAICGSMRTDARDSKMSEPKPGRLGRTAK